MFLTFSIFQYFRQTKLLFFLVCTFKHSRSSSTRGSSRSFPDHQQPHPARQPAEEEGLPHPGLGDRRLHHHPPALRFSLNMWNLFVFLLLFFNVTWESNPRLDRARLKKQNIGEPWGAPEQKDMSVGPVSWTPTWTTGLAPGSGTDGGIADQKVVYD